jgi:hypothetical protein
MEFRILRAFEVLHNGQRRALASIWWGVVSVILAKRTADGLA